MRFSAVAALCAAPLVLAGSLEAEFVSKRGQDIEVRGEASEVSSNKVTIIESTQADVIVIWVNEGGGAATQTVTETKTVTATGGSAVAAATHQVVVGGSSGLVYTPETITAEVGDMVVFTFMSMNHTLTQSTFGEPCVKLAGGMASGFMPNVNNTVVPAPQMAMQVTVATPLWFYCAQTAHCGKGMTFSINPTAEKSQALFKSMAISQNGTGTVSPIAGGTAVASVVAAPATSVAAVASAAASMATGTGSVDAAGACGCSCLCGVAAFPNVAVQGLNSYGGLSGSVAMSALES
ncbi:hypothetical protein BJ878DRAFT_15102 [Calycina marina]|uniref:Uncharacterized protein n=1 Tax=Calycina marina TaxID=1763456 RepID=A0A9P7Z5G1_9HELO|nr:hypothetical protein BJ878DRAFT_15102 [Calycina marina]